MDILPVMSGDADVMGGKPDYREWAPPAALSGTVACVWRRRSAGAGAPPVLVLPDGCVDLIWESERGAYLAGPDTGPVPTSLAGGRSLAGVRFLPGAGGHVLGVPLASLHNLRVDATEWWPAGARLLPGALEPAEALRRLIQLTGMLVQERPPDREVIEAGRLLRRPDARVSDLGPLLGLGDRQVRRRFIAAVGYGPKTLHRILRFRHVVLALTASAGPVARQPAGGQATQQRAGPHVPADLATLALRAGYADQAHLTRETGRLAGMTPVAVARALGAAITADAITAAPADAVTAMPADAVTDACGG